MKRQGNVGGSASDERVRRLMTKVIGGSDVDLAPRGFEASVILFRGEGEVDNLIAEVSPLHCNLLQRFRAWSAQETPYWFYITCPDNVLDVLEWTRPCRFDKRDERMPLTFAKQPAVEGGVSFLGLVASNAGWLYWLDFDPSVPELVASFHGTNEMCREIAHVSR